MRKSLMFSCAAILALAGASMAPQAAFAQSQRDTSQVQTDPAQQSPQEKFIQDLGNQGISIVQDKNLTPTQHADKYRDLLTAAFDMPTVAKFVLGRAWATATPEQQQEFVKTFASLVSKNYGEKLNLYSGEKFQVKGSRPESDKDVIVNSVVTHPAGTPPTPIDWRVRQEGDKYAILDVVVEGISQSVTQRQEYASVLQRNNGNIDGLLTVMKQSLQQASNTPSPTQ